MIEVEEIRKCQYCGKPYKKQILELFGTKKEIFVMDCNCSIEAEERAKEEKRQAEIYENRRLKTIELQNALNCPLISPLFEGKTFDTYKPINNAEYIKNWQYCYDFALNFKSGSAGMLMIGNVGAGKTTLQACICNELKKRGKFSLLINFGMLIDTIMQANDFTAKIKPAEIYKTLTKFDYVVIDDLGREGYTDSKLSIAQRIIETLLNYNVTTSITANPDRLERLFKMLEYKAIADRISDLCPNRLIFSNKSFRGANCKEI